MILDYTVLLLYVLALVIYLTVHIIYKHKNTRAFVWLPPAFVACYMVQLMKVPIAAWLLLAVIIFFSAKDENMRIHFTGPVHVIFTILGFAASLAVAVLTHLQYKDLIFIFFNDGMVTAIQNLWIMFLIWCAVIQSGSILCAFVRIFKKKEASVDKEQPEEESPEEMTVSTDNSSAENMEADKSSVEVSAMSEDSENTEEEAAEDMVEVKEEKVPFFRRTMEPLVGLIPYYLIFAFVAMIVFRSLINVLMTYDNHMDTFWDIVRVSLTSANAILNVFFVLCLSLTISCLFGLHIGQFVTVLVVVMAFIANYIKVTYHATFFSWLDVISIKEGVLIVVEFLKPWQWALVGLGVLLVLFLIIWNIRKIGRFLIPHPRPVRAIPILVVTVGFILSLWSKGFDEAKIYPLAWENAIINVQYNGVFIHLLYDFKNLREAFMKQPSDYSQAKSEELKAEFEEMGKKIQKEKSIKEKLKTTKKSKKKDTKDNTETIPETNASGSKKTSANDLQERESEETDEKAKATSEDTDEKAEAASEDTGEKTEAASEDTDEKADADSEATADKKDTADKEKKNDNLTNAAKNVDKYPQPDVILILSESLFDLEKVPDLNLDKDINKTIEKYQNINMISPRYGGYTSAVEFEVLTGMSLAFLPEGIIPYTTYFNGANKTFPSVVQNFNANGYYTEAIHPNLPNFYNRKTVYKNLQFDIFKSNEAFGNVGPERSTENGWVTDKFLGQVIANELANREDDAPRFIFGITMEGHYVTQDKYKETEVHVHNKAIDKKEVHEIEQQAQSYKNADRMIKYLIKYMNYTDRPTLLYVFGDHLAPIEYLKNSDYILDKDSKYTTTFIRYSNYKELDTGGVEAISPNQIAAFMMVDSGIKHDSYFDYLFSLQKTYPVIHKEYVDANDEAFDLYKYIQYDVMFGKHYLSDCVK